MTRGKTDDSEGEILLHVVCGCSSKVSIQGSTLFGFMRSDKTSQPSLADCNKKHCTNLEVSDLPPEIKYTGTIEISY